MKFLNEPSYSPLLAKTLSGGLKVSPTSPTNDGHGRKIEPKLAIGMLALFKTCPIPVSEGGFIGEAPRNTVENIVPDIVSKVGAD